MVQCYSASFTEVARQLRERIDQSLDSYTQLGAGCPARLREAMRYSLLAPGKRLRPILVLLAAEACGCHPEAAMPAACAVEMIHAYSLVHDDLPAMDNDDLRRGRPTCHKQFDEATAILTGDALLTLAFQVVASDVQPPAVAAACCSVLAQAAGATALVGGQADDLAGQFSNGGVEQLQLIHARKTGAMFLVSLQLGALIARASDEQQQALEVYGRKLGLAFQIADDLLDVQGEQEHVGKRVGKDSDRGKLTFPGLLGIEESARQARTLIDEACAALAPLGASAAHLEVLAQYVLERNR